MKPCLKSLVVIFFPVALWAQKASLPKVALWPGNRTAAISLTFDDGLISQLDDAAPVLKKNHLTGTFFVITGSKTWLDHIPEWRQLEADGDEIGSHTVHHPCTLPGIKPNGTTYTAAMMKAELQQSADSIIAALGVHRGLTFAYPCDDETFGPPWQAEPSQVTYLSYVAQYYFAARMDNGGLPNNPPELNPLTIHGLSRTHDPRIHFAQLLAMLNPVVDTHQWGVYVFHGIGEQYLATNQQAFDQLCAYLQQHPEIWTATFGDAVRYILERRSLEIQPAQTADRAVSLRLQWPANPRIYDLPLTLTWALPPGWTACQVRADGHPLNAKVMVQSGHTVALVDVPAQTKVLLFER
jgi:sialate O-acetylesterase